jgi:hypothetical protein
LANAIRIAHDGSGAKTDFKLKAVDMVVDHDRSPISAPIPYTNPILIDLGQWKVNITISGKCDFPGTDQSEGGVAIADMDDLVQMADSSSANPWHSNTITLTDTTSTTTLTYTVKIGGVKIEKRDAQEYYSFTLKLVGFMTNDFDP